MEIVPLLHVQHQLGFIFRRWQILRYFADVVHLDAAHNLFIFQLVDRLVSDDKGSDYAFRLDVIRKQHHFFRVGKRDSTYRLQSTSSAWGLW